MSCSGLSEVVCKSSPTCLWDEKRGCVPSQNVARTRFKLSRVPTIPRNPFLRPQVEEREEIPGEDGCKPGKIRNPRSKRCVNRDGAIGREILEARSLGLEFRPVDESKEVP